MICHRIPFPPDKGDKIRAFHLLRHLTKRFDVCLGAFVDDPADLVHCETLAEMCVETKFISIDPKVRKIRSLSGLLRRQPLSFAFYQSAPMREFVGRIRNSSGLVAEIGFSSAMAPYLDGAAAPTFLDMVDADSAKFTSYAEDGSIIDKLVYGREGKLLAREEKIATAKCVKTFLVTPEEAARVENVPGVDPTRIDYFRNGVDLEYWRADAPFEKAAQAFDIVFTGAMDYRPNIEAVTAFVGDVWPMVREQVPRATFGIVGARPTPEVLKLGSIDGVAVTGRVADMRSYLGAAKIAVAPLKIARGVQNKVLEAMAMGTPVVASSGAILGTGASPGEHLVSADTAQEKLAAIVGLWSDPALALRMGASGAGFIRENYAWENTLKRFDRALDAAI